LFSHPVIMQDSSRRGKAETTLKRSGLRAVTGGLLPTRFVEEPLLYSHVLANLTGCD
jgi:hypothetical protein